MRVYFDYNATTPPSPEVVERVLSATRELFGNASSVHHFGQQAKAALDEARSAVADGLIVWDSKRASTNRSIALTGQAMSCTGGSAERVGGINDQTG